MRKTQYQYGDLVHYTYSKWQKGFAIFMCDRPEKDKAILEMQGDKIVLEEVYYERFCVAQLDEGLKWLDYRIKSRETEIQRLKSENENKKLRMEKNVLKRPILEQQIKDLEEKAVRYELPLKLIGKTKSEAPDILQMRSRLNNIKTNINRCKHKMILGNSQNSEWEGYIKENEQTIIRLERELAMWQQRHKQFLAHFK